MTKKCSVENCTNKHHAKGFCKKHYNEFYKYGRIRTKEEKIAMEKSKEKVIKYCEICGSSEKVHMCKKIGKYLCSKHYAQYQKNGKFLKETRFNKNEIIYYNTYAEIILKNIEYQEVGRALISLEDVDRIKDYKWHLNSQGYAQVHNKQGYIKLHRLIMNAKEDECIDHINGNRLDNRRENLRVCTKTENNRNTKPRNSKSGYMGVYQVSKNSYEAYININKKKIHLGCYPSAEKAYEIRLEAEKEYFGEFAPSVSRKDGLYE